jgi:hypothetical protein
VNARRRLITACWLLLASLAVGACGSSNDGEAASPVTDPVTTTRPWACGPSEQGCTSDEVAATVALLYERAGASATEAACIAPISARGATAVNEAFNAPSALQTRDAIACVGSEDRLREIGTALADDLVEGIPDLSPSTHPDPTAVAAGICATWRQAARAATAVFFANKGRYPTTFDELTAGLRPPLELEGDVRASGSVLNPTDRDFDWTITMTGSGAQPSFTCDPST